MPLILAKVRPDSQGLQTPPCINGLTRVGAIVFAQEDVHSVGVGKKAFLIKHEAPPQKVIPDLNNPSVTLMDLYRSINTID